MKDTLKAKAIRRARWHLARMLCENIYTEENREEWIRDILVALRDYLNDTIQNWDEFTPT